MGIAPSLHISDVAGPSVHTHVIPDRNGHIHTYSRSQKSFRFDNSKRKLLSVPFGYVSFRSVPFCIVYAVYKNDNL